MSRLVDETVHYLGCRGRADEVTITLVKDCLAELETTATPRSLYRPFPVRREGERLCIATLCTTSHGLARHLEGCDMAVLFAATLGSGVDALLRRAAVSDMARAVVLQAAACAVIEHYCDSVCDEAATLPELGGRQLRPRFSPGYGDLELGCQPQIIEILGCHKIGLGCTQTLMLAPQKSVTAIMGAGSQPFCHSSGCAACDKTNCTFRREP